MEQQEPRRRYVKNLPEFVSKIKLNDEFWKQLKTHSNKEYIEGVMNYSDDTTRLVFIMLEFTRERSTCNQMITILENSGNLEAAQELKEYNTSPPLMPYSNDTTLTVTKTNVSRSGGTKYFDMSGSKLCIIINEVKKELENESLRFQSVFSQVGFDVELYYDLTAQQIKDLLNEVSDRKRLFTDKALIVMTISHGQNQKIIASDRKEIKITDIVSIFSKCTALKDKPKLYFFNCCRVEVPQVIPVRAVQYSGGQVIIGLDCDTMDWKIDQAYTFICFACAQGEMSWFQNGLYTSFGQAFSHCIAQYSCDKSIQTIMNLTNDRMDQSDRPEIRLCKMTRELYLNPGLQDVMDTN